MCCVSSAAPEGHGSPIRMSTPTNVGWCTGVSGAIWREVLRLRKVTEAVVMQAAVVYRVTQLALRRVNSRDKLKRLCCIEQVSIGGSLAPGRVLTSGV